MYFSSCVSDPYDFVKFVVEEKEEIITAAIEHPMINIRAIAMISLKRGKLISYYRNASSIIIAVGNVELHTYTRIVVELHRTELGQRPTGTYSTVP